MWLFRTAESLSYDFRTILHFADEVVNLEAVDLEAVDLEAVDLEAVDLEAVDLEGVDLEAVDLEADDWEAQLELRLNSLVNLELWEWGEYSTNNVS